MSADPHIQAPTDTQSLNRYSYVLNNPLSATDPSGYFSKQAFRQLFSIALVIVLPGAGAGAVIAKGALAGLISTGTAKGTLTGAFSAGVFFGIGEAFQGINAAKAAKAAEAAFSRTGVLSYAKQVGDAANALTQAQFAGKILAHAVAGGVMSSLQGGKFGHGFASAGFTQSLAGAIGNLPTPEVRILAAAIVGGTVSQLTGGKFANGALTAAFSRAFNEEAGKHTKRVNTIEVARAYYTNWLKGVSLSKQEVSGILDQIGYSKSEFSTPRDADGAARLALVEAHVFDATFHEVLGITIDKLIEYSPSRGLAFDRKVTAQMASDFASDYNSIAKIARFWSHRNDSQTDLSGKFKAAHIGPTGVANIRDRIRIGERIKYEGE